LTRMLFCRVGWMPKYQGEKDSQGKVDIQGGGKFVPEHGFGYEMYNFLPDDQGNVYGYVRGGGKMDIDRLGAKRGDKSISQVLVIWVATHPKEGGMCIVGWYNDATVFRSHQPCPQHLTGKRPLPDRSYQWGFRVVAKYGDTLLLGENNRTFLVPQATEDSSGMGQRHIWYADEKKDQALRQRVLEYVENKGHQRSGY
jgi:hypothetical protein